MPLLERDGASHDSYEQSDAMPYCSHRAPCGRLPIGNDPDPSDLGVERIRRNGGRGRAWTGYWVCALRADQ